MSRIKKITILFKTIFFISMTANSGYAILSVMKANFIGKYHWFTEDEMADYTALIQSTPGPIAINASMIIGYQAAGLPGSFAAVLGCTLPPLLIMTGVTFFYDRIISDPNAALFMKGMQFGVTAMLLDVLLGLFMNVTKKEKLYPCCLILFSLIYLKVSDLSVFYLALACIVVSLVRTWFINKAPEKK